MNIASAWKEVTSRTYTHTQFIKVRRLSREGNYHRYTNICMFEYTPCLLGAHTVLSSVSDILASNLIVGPCGSVLIIRLA
jgi:hypothetical protein